MFGHPKPTSTRRKRPLHPNNPPSASPKFRKTAPQYAAKHCLEAHTHTEPNAVDPCPGRKPPLLPASAARQNRVSALWQAAGFFCPRQGTQHFHQLFIPPRSRNIENLILVHHLHRLFAEIEALTPRARRVVALALVGPNSPPRRCLSK